MKSKPKILFRHFAVQPEEFDIDRFEVFELRDNVNICDGNPSLAVPLASRGHYKNRTEIVPISHFIYPDCYFIIDDVEYRFPNKKPQEIYKTLCDVIYEKIVEYQLSSLDDDSV